MTIQDYDDGNLVRNYQRIGADCKINEMTEKTVIDSFLSTTQKITIRLFFAFNLLIYIGFLQAWHSINSQASG